MTLAGNERKSEILIYSAPDGAVKIDVRLEDETLWLSQKAMAGIFGVNVPAISKHIDNIFETGELEKDSTVSKMEIVQNEGNREVKRQIEHFNLDVVIQMNGRELLTHAGKISHNEAVEKSGLEYEKYREQQKKLEYKASLKELEQDIKDLKKQGNLRPDSGNDSK